MSNVIYQYITQFFVTQIPPPMWMLIWHVIWEMEKRMEVREKYSFP